MSNLFLLKDLAKISGQSVHTLKYYLKIGLIKEVGRFPETRFRYFGNPTLYRLKTIRKLRKNRISIKEIKEMLKK